MNVMTKKITCPCGNAIAYRGDAYPSYRCYGCSCFPCKWKLEFARGKDGKTDNFSLWMNGYYYELASHRSTPGSDGEGRLTLGKRHIIVSQAAVGQRAEYEKDERILIPNGTDDSMLADGWWLRLRELEKHLASLTTG